MDAEDNKGISALVNEVLLLLGVLRQQHMLQELLGEDRIILLAGQRGALLDVLLRALVDVPLATLVDEHLVDGLAQEALVEAADAVSLVSLVNYLDKVSLLEQANSFLDTLRIV